MKFSLILLINFLFVFIPVKKDIPKSIYDHKVASLNGREIDFAAYKGKKILVVNVPCVADYSRQYAELDALYKKYKDKLVVIGFLTDDFAVPPGSKQQPADYHQKSYNVSFPITAKVLIKGPDMTPVFRWLTYKKYNNLKNSEVKWDFQKYLINEKGVLVAVFDPKIKANNPALISAIEK